jgi:hypothetical protein
MLKEILKAVDEARARDAEQRADWARTDASKRGRTGMQGVLEDAAERSGTPYAKECCALVMKLLSGQITKSDFEETRKLLSVADTKTKCRICFDEGLVIDNGVKRCRCLSGQRISERSYAAARADGAREYVVIPTIS